METVDSEKEMLDPPIIMARSAEQQGLQGNNLVQMLGVIAAEMSLRNASTVQVGNTVFLTHYSKDLKKGYGKTFNLDTAKNFVRNILIFFGTLQKKGVTHYTADFDGTVYLNAVRLLQKILKKQTDSRVYIGKLPDGGYRMYGKVGKEPYKVGVT